MATEKRPLPKQSAKSPNPFNLKQAANWQCRSCGRVCRHQGETPEDFAIRMGHDVDEITAHPRRWILHVTQLPGQTTSHQNVTILCGSCHRTYHNRRRRQHRQQRLHQQLEQWGQLTLNDIRLPLSGLQLSLSEWGTPYEIVNPSPPRKRFRATPSD